MKYLVLLIALSFLSGCEMMNVMNQSSTVRAPRTSVSTVQTEPTQLGVRQIEVRRLEVPYETAYNAAAQAMFDLGYSVSHSDKASGILTGSRMVGLQAFKEEKPTEG